MIKYPDAFAAATPAGFDGVFDWDFLKPAFEPTEIMPMDIDGIVERRGKFLLFETKAPGKAIPQGQRITLKALIMLGQGKIHLMVLYGKTSGEIVGMEEWYYQNGNVAITECDCDSAYVLQRARNWFQYANT